MNEFIIQGVISFMSLAALHFSLHPTKQRFACLFGFVVQPLWMIDTAKHDQWGMFALCFVYLFLYIRSFRRHWIK